MYEAGRGFLWLEGVLSADAQLTSLAPGGVWRGMAPVGTLQPYVVLTRQDGHDTTNAYGVRLKVDETYQVVAYAPAAQYPALLAAADRLDALLQPGGFPMRNVTLSDGSGAIMLCCTRTKEIALDELVDGVLWSRAGALYEVLIAPNGNLHTP